MEVLQMLRILNFTEPFQDMFLQARRCLSVSPYQVYEEHVLTFC